VAGTVTRRIDVRSFARSPTEALTDLASTTEGLTQGEAAERLRVVGRNSLPEPSPDPLWRLVLRQLRSAVVWLLLIGVALSLITGDQFDAAAIGVVLLLNVVIGTSMEAGAGRALRALRELETPRALVVRDGITREVPAAELVPGDIIVLEEGAIVPADGRLLEATELRTSEAVLTGESEAVDKDATALVGERAPIAERRTMVYQATSVAAGRGRAVVTATGAATELGSIGRLTAGVRPSRTPLERKLDTLGGQLAVAAVVLAAVVVAFGAVRGVALPELLRLGIALAVATVPEGLPVVATIALAVGLRRMARQHALVRHLPSVETLGSVTVVCADKTGTLTAGAMTVTALWCAERDITVSGSGLDPTGSFTAQGAVDPHTDTALGELLRCAALSARASVEHRDDAWRAAGDPTDAALVVVALKAGLHRDKLQGAEPLAWELPFSSARRLSVSAHRQPDGTVRAYVKGSPRIVLERCTALMTGEGVRPLGDAERAAVGVANAALAGAGLRVLAVASGVVAETSQVPGGLTLTGLVAMTDPPAEGVLEAISALRRAGVRTVMITGDQSATAAAIAQHIGILTSAADVMDARELEAMDDAALRARLRHISVFSRVSPEGKLRIVESFQRSGELVAMLGDGVNDAAALRRAEIGVAMGRRGTDVAKEAAAIVLEDDRFPTIVAALEQGRVIFDNLRKFVYYLVSCNLAEMLVVVAFTIGGLPMPFTALQILWLNLVTDTVPALALAAEPGDPLVMQRPPYPPGRPILTRATLASAGGHALLLTAVTILAFVAARAFGDGDAKTIAFLTLATSQILHLGNARSVQPVLQRGRILANTAALGAAAFSVALLVATVHYAPLARVLALQSISAASWMLVFALSAIPAIIGQLWRARPRRSTHH
jgi:P-type Ca2+ transporter type 2C